jgi:hypothetical protein
MERRLDHLFHPWVRTPSLQDRAHHYLDISFLVNAITHVGHDAVVTSQDADVRRDVTIALANLHHKLGIPPSTRRMTM